MTHTVRDEGVVGQAAGEGTALRQPLSEGMPCHCSRASRRLPRPDPLWAEALTPALPLSRKAHCGPRKGLVSGLPEAKHIYCAHRLPCTHVCKKTFCFARKTLTLWVPVSSRKVQPWRRPTTAQTQTNDNMAIRGRRVSPTQGDPVLQGTLGVSGCHPH